ncbi:hypothetical protein [Desulforamulus aeronauticus]|uniref:Uncharacterized protein n=1 Tax=Desulforamulus aeronauticus DSM 10349 TaxID=1121421 RepID=A0A1M6QR23_9FIRM|nr:hypothetical protein [Desulforamulus aeronauticus]SHK22477.1 hypothetical protein SAMN02745123_01125 [Desulforamulus aeronauticus DSM 10349]
MFGEIKLFWELQTHKNDPDKLAEIFYLNRDVLLSLKKKYPEWKTYLQPEVFEALKEKGLPMD